MEMKSRMQRSPSRKKSALKKIYSGIAILAGYNENDEFTDFIRMALYHFEKYGLDKLYKLESNKVVCLKSYKTRKEKI
jgi:hypothetical protein